MCKMTRLTDIKVALMSSLSSNAKSPFTQSLHNTLVGIPFQKNNILPYQKKQVVGTVWKVRPPCFAYDAQVSSYDGSLVCQCLGATG